MSSGKMPRHALGLPAGSVRALLSFAVLAMLWALVAFAMSGKGKGQVPLSFLYLNLIMLMIFGHYFTAHGRNIGSDVSYRPPLGLPKGVVRILLILGYGGLAGFLFYRQQQSPLEFPDVAGLLPFLGALIGGFILGYMMTGFFTWVGGGDLPAAVQDVQAWVALLAVVGLVVSALIHTVINPGVSLDQRLNVNGLEAVLAGLVGFYFGARS